MSDVDYQILVIEDDPSVAAGLVSGLKKRDMVLSLPAMAQREPLWLSKINTI